VRWHRGSIAVIALVLALGAVAGCVESDPDSAQTPSGATTVMNSAPQTDSEGNTITAPSGPTATGEQPPGGGEEPTPGGGEEPTPGGGGGGGGAAGDAEAGLTVFQQAGCGSCHVFAAGGGAGNIGPDLDQTLQGMSPEQIETSIVDPEAEIVEGYSPGIMPSNFGDQLSEEDLANLVAALSQ